ncbi:MAG: DUF373 family protein [Euryarchaeota archaeon]|nr:DUF373 family protein [Euryarchaeota archaeon]
MRLLVLNVDRDDDLGRKTGIRAPIIGREAMLEAATALALADPEEADANGMFAAIKEYDEILRRKLEYDAEDVFVGAVTGHVREGLFADNAIAHQIDEIIAQTKADAVVLISDGAEDEHVLPILKTRAKVNGVKRVIIKQARNLEGVLFLFNRLIHDEKLQRRFFLPLALLLIAAGLAIIYRRPELFVASGLFLAAFYILVQVFSLNVPIGTLFFQLGKQMKAGKLSLFASILAFGIAIWGGYQTVADAGVAQAGEAKAYGTYSLLFAHTIWWWIVAAILLIVVGRGMDRYVRERVARARHWEGSLFFLAAATVGYAAIDALVVLDGRIAPDEALDVVNIQFLTWIFFGGFLFFSGLIAHKYFVQVNQARLASGPGPK